MKPLNSFRLVASLFALITLTHLSNAQSCPSNILTDPGGYYGGFESGKASIGASRGSTDLSYGSAHGDYQVISPTLQPWSSVTGGGYLRLNPHSGNYMMLVHTDDSRLWYKQLSVVPGQTLHFSAWIASAKAKPANGFEVRLRVKYGNTTAVIASATAPQGAWSQISAAFTVPAGVSSVEFQIIDPYSNTNISNFLFLDDICLTPVVSLYPDVNITHVNVPVTGSVRTNDAVPANSTYGVPVADSKNPAGATISMNSDGSYTFNAGASPGVYAYQVPVCAGAQSINCPTTLLSITVLKKGTMIHPPVANTDFTVTKAGTAATLNTLANDYAGYVGGVLNPAAIAIVSAPKNGTATVDLASGNIVYQPAPGFSGNDTLQYRVYDKTQPAALSSTAYQIITVKAAGSANSTLAADDYAYTPQNTAVSGNVKLNDSDPEGNAQTVAPQSVTIAGKGTLVLASTGDFTFTPANNFTGPASFVYNTCDNGTPQACMNATLYVLVQLTAAQSTLPVQNLSFSGKAVGEQVQLGWVTASEANTSHFAIGYSTDGNSWQSIGRVKAAGNSNEKTAYSFVHPNPAGNVNYYRLQVVDADGSSTVSNTVVVRLAGGKTSISRIYPNPFRGTIQVGLRADASAKAVVQILDMNGRLVRQTEKPVQKGDNLLVIDKLENLNKGTYLLKLVIGDATLTEKIYK